MAPAALRLRAQSCAASHYSASPAAKTKRTAGKVCGHMLSQLFGRFVAKADSSQGTGCYATWSQRRILPYPEAPVYPSDAVDAAAMIWSACSVPTPRLIIVTMPQVNARWLDLCVV
jgi:hypothetical protein